VVCPDLPDLPRHWGGFILDERHQKLMEMQHVTLDFTVSTRTSAAREHVSAMAVSTYDTFFCRSSRQALD
jgi:hypothetical protein